MKNETGFGRDMVKGMAEFHGGDQLDKSRESEGFHFGTLPSRWQKWDFKTRCAGNGATICLLNPAPGFAAVYSGQVDLAEQVWGATFLK